MWDSFESFPRLLHMPFLHCKNKVWKKDKKGQLSIFQVPVCIICPEAITGPSDGEASLISASFKWVCPFGERR